MKSFGLESVANHKLVFIFVILQIIELIFTNNSCNGGNRRHLAFLICNGELAYCLNGVCVECLSNENCTTASLSYCVNNTCVECLSNGNCTTENCTNNSCTNNNTNINNTSHMSSDHHFHNNSNSNKSIHASSDIDKSDSSLIINHPNHQGSNQKVILITSVTIGAAAAVAGGIALYKVKFCFGANRVSRLFKQCCCDTNKADASRSKKSKNKKEKQLENVDKELDKI